MEERIGIGDWRQGAGVAMVGIGDWKFQVGGEVWMEETLMCGEDGLMPGYGTLRMRGDCEL